MTLYKRCIEAVWKVYREFCLHICKNTPHIWTLSFRFSGEKQIICVVAFDIRKIFLMTTGTNIRQKK